MSQLYKTDIEVLPQARNPIRRPLHPKIDLSAFLFDERSGLIENAGGLATADTMSWYDSHLVPCEMQYCGSC